MGIFTFYFSLIELVRNKLFTYPPALGVKGPLFKMEINYKQTANK